MPVLKLFQFHFLLLILIYLAVNLIAFHLNYFIELFYIDIILNQTKLSHNKFTKLLQFLMKTPIQFLLLLQE